MPNRAAHLQQATNNQAVLKKLWDEKPNHLDWVVTVAFYVAVHRIEAYLATKLPPDGVHCKDHDSRNGAVSKFSELKSIYGDYQELYNRSRESRYDCKFKKWDAPLVQKLLEKVNNIEKHLNARSP